jgi:hypothetical protein
VALFFAPVPCGVKRAGEREAFILGAPIGWFWKRLYSEIGFPPSHESSNNPLAAEPESENDAARFFRKTYCRFYLWSKRPPPATTKGFIQMINTLKRATRLAPSLSFAAILAIALPAFAQAPSQAQRDAIKSQCRSDYMAHCSSVPPGGEASLQCLQKNMGVPGRGARRGSAGSCDRQASRDCQTNRDCEAGRDRGAESRGAGGGGDCSSQGC